MRRGMHIVTVHWSVLLRTSCSGAGRNTMPSECLQRPSASARPGGRGGHRQRSGFRARRCALRLRERTLISRRIPPLFPAAGRPGGCGGHHYRQGLPGRHQALGLCPRQHDPRLQEQARARCVPCRRLAAGWLETARGQTRAWGAAAGGARLGLRKVRAGGFGWRRGLAAACLECRRRGPACG